MRVWLLKIVGLILFLFIFFIESKAQKVLVTGEAECLIEDVNLMKKYEYDVMQSAINNALYKAFGSSITSNYESISQTTMDGRSVLSHSESRNQFVNSYPNGVWKGQKKDPEYSTYKDEKGNWWLTCKVTGYAVEMIASPVEFTAKVLDGFDIIKDEDVDFINGETGYLYFRGAKAGYLTIFYDDFKTIQRCLPYNAMQENSIEVKPNHDYIFFSPEKNEIQVDPVKVDEIEFYTSNPLEYNQFYIMFSPNEINPPVLSDEKEIPDNYKTFKSMDREKFQHWLQNERLKNKDLQIQIIGVTIKNPQD